MTITLTMYEDWELWAEANPISLQQTQGESFEIIREIPKRLGKGYVRDIEVYPELWLMIVDYEYHDDVLCRIPEWNHPCNFASSFQVKSRMNMGGSWEKDIRASLVAVFNAK